MDGVTITISDHLTLRSWTLADAPILFALVDENREHLSPWLAWVPHTQTVADSERFISEGGFELGIWQSDTLVGCIGLHELDRLHKKTSLGYWLGHRYTGRGIMTKSVKALTTYCFEELGLNRVELRAAVDNQKSNAVARKLWFKKEGTLRQAELINGIFVDDIVYSMLKKDWVTSRV